MRERLPRPFVTALIDLTQWLEAACIPSMIVGGIAASILGRGLLDTFPAANVESEGYDRVCKNSPVSFA